MTLRNIKQSIALALFLIILPLGSWYYLKQGYGYRKLALSEMVEVGDLKGISLKSFDNKELSLDSSHVYLFQLNENPAIKQSLDKIMKAYDARTDVLCFKVPCNGLRLSDTSHLHNIIPVLPDSALCKRLSDIVELIEKSHPIKPDVLLMNTKQKIVQGYELDKSDERARLIKHVSITMPGVKKVEKISKKAFKEK